MLEKNLKGVQITLRLDEADPFYWEKD